jgi:hypothetical protein
VTHAMTLPEHVARTIVPDPLDSCRAIAALALGVSPAGNAVELVARYTEHVYPLLIHEKRAGEGTFCRDEVAAKASRRW